LQIPTFFVYVFIYYLGWVSTVVGPAVPNKRDATNVLLNQPAAEQQTEAVGYQCLTRAAAERLVDVLHEGEYASAMCPADSSKEGPVTV